MVSSRNGVAISDTAPRQPWLLMMTSSLFYSVCASIAFAHHLLHCLVVRTYSTPRCLTTPVSSLPISPLLCGFVTTFSDRLTVSLHSMYGSFPCSFTPSVCLLLPDCLILPRPVSLYLVVAFTSSPTVVLTFSQFLVVGPSNHANSPDASALDGARHDASWSRLGAGSPS